MSTVQVVQSAAENCRLDSFKNYKKTAAVGDARCGQSLSIRVFQEVFLKEMWEKEVLVSTQEANVMELIMNDNVTRKCL